MFIVKLGTIINGDFYCIVIGSIYLICASHGGTFYVRITCLSCYFPTSNANDNNCRGSLWAVARVHTQPHGSLLGPVRNRELARTNFPPSLPTDNIFYYAIFWQTAVRMGVVSHLIDVASAFAVLQSTTLAVLGTVSLLFLYRRLFSPTYAKPGVLSSSGILCGYLVRWAIAGYSS